MAIENPLDATRHMPPVQIVERESNLPSEIVITANEAVRAKLGAKLEEYTRRISGIDAAETDPGDVFKKEILERLFTTGQVSLEEVEGAMKERYGTVYAHVVGAFENAWLVINAYNTGDTGAVQGGTGLAK